MSQNPRALASRRVVHTLVACVLAVAAAPSAQPVEAAGVPAFDHVFVIVMENRSFGEIIGSPSAPYINRLLPSAALATSYYAVAHPSLPNYLALTSGTTWNITSDCTTCWISGANIGDLLENAGSSWKAYEESMPSPCFVGDSYPYAQKHDPFMYYNDLRNNTARCQSHVVPYTQLATDLRSTSTTPNYSFITPNMCNDMHDCSVATGDAWLSQQVPQILASPAFKTQRSLLALTWDEDDFSGTNKVPLLLLGANVRAGYRGSTTYNHYSLLRTIELARDLVWMTTNDEFATSMSDMFSASVPLPTDPCQTAALSATPASPQPTGTAVQFMASSTACPGPQYEFWMLAPGTTAYQLLQAYSSSNTFPWSTTGLATGTYTLVIWVRDVDSAGTYGNQFGRWDAYAILPYTLGARVCTGAVNASASPASPAGVGTSVTITANASGCPDPNPLYQFWVLPPGDTAYQQIQSYSTSNTVSWHTAGLVPGRYRFSVWARDAGSAGVYGNQFGTWDTYASFSYFVSSCSSLPDSISPASATGVGASVTFTASAAGCPNPSPVYQFWLLAPGASGWTSVQAYSNANTWTWNTTGKAPGVYRVAVWLRDADSGGAYSNSSGSWDVASFISYTVTTCTGVSLSTTTSGSSVVFTAKAAGCPNPSPVYEFWVLAPGASSWTLVQAYSTSNTWTWSTAGKSTGTYQVAVWVRDAKSGGGYSNQFGTWDVFSSSLYALT
jgi:hypothetical protein